MKTVQVVNADTDEILTSITEYEDGIKGITVDGYKVIVDGKELINEKNHPSDKDDLQETFLDAAKALARAAEADAKTAAPSTCEKALNAARASLILIETYEKLTRLL